VSQPLRIVFFGTPEFAVPSLQALLRGSDPVVGVICQPDRPAGRGQHLQAPPVKQAALAAGVPVLQPLKIRTTELLDALKAWRPDLMVVAAYGRILPRSILDLPAHGCINVHASLLPKYRGAAPIQWAILRGEERTGVTIMRIAEELDAGDMLLQRDTAIAADETYGELQTRLADLGATALTAALVEMHAGALTASPQDPRQVTLAPPLEKAQGRIDWSRPAAEICRQVRAFNPWPSAFTHADGKLLKIHRAHAEALQTAKPAGAVVTITPQILVASGDGTVVLDELQLEGRKRLAAAEVSRGGSLRAGMVLGHDAT